MAEDRIGEDDTLQTFLLFPKLPTEIRLKIWHLILDTHRTISFKYTAESSNSEVKNPETGVLIRPLGCFRIEQDNAPAVLLDVNTEAREEALALYKERISSVIRVGHPAWMRFNEEHVVQLPTEEKSIPISFPNTTFFLSTRDLTRVPSSVLQQFQHIRFSILDPGYFFHFTIRALKSMTSLRTLTLAGKENVKYGWNSARPEWWEDLVREFETEKLSDLEWECPLVSILDLDTGEKLAEIEAGKGDPEKLVSVKENEEIQEMVGELDEWHIQI